MAARSKPPPHKRPLPRRLMPDGTCWCGCGEETPAGTFFAQGHDRRAISKVILVEYGDTVTFLHAHGFAPGGQHFPRRDHK